MIRAKPFHVPLNVPKAVAHDATDLTKFHPLTGSSPQRYLLAEIIKQSHLHPTVLLQFIRNTGIEPAWSEIVAPFGAYQASDFTSDFIPVAKRVPLTGHLAWKI